jgi:hypothetical protein
MIVTNFNSFVPKVTAKTLTIKDVYYGIVNNGGITFNPYNKLPDTGYIVSLNGGKKIDNFMSYSIEKRLDYIYNWSKRAITETTYYGFWLDKGTLYCDVSKVFIDKEKAIKFGISQNQLSIYDIQNKIVVWL